MEFVERRLPVYLLLDCSESMVGEGIEGVRRGVNALLMDLCSDPYALETVWVSVITFADSAEQAVPLTELTSFGVPPLRVRPGTAFGGALSLLDACVRREVRKHAADAKGDWRPLVFLLTDGVPTDDWRGPLEAMGRSLNFVAIGCGPEADGEILGQISENVLMMGEGEEDFRELFSWISASLSTASRSIGTASGGPSGPVSLAKPPSGLFTTPEGRRGTHRDGPQGQLFVAARCSETRGAYLVRYRLSGHGGGFYEPVRTHEVDEDYFRGGGEAVGPDLSSGSMLGILPCPRCGNEAAGKCPCGTLFCCEAGQGELVCPGCGSPLSLGGGGDVSISGRLG